MTTTTASAMGQIKKTLRHRAEGQAVNPSLLRVEHDVPFTGRSTTGSKFSVLFKDLRPGSSIRCERNEVESLAHALLKAVRSGDYPAIKGCVVKRNTTWKHPKTGEVSARVWVLPAA